MTGDEIVLKRTCSACPEQYDAFFNGALVGYLRLRHGYFYCENTSDGSIVYEAENSAWGGCFDETSRVRELGIAIGQLASALNLA
jgi:hypothetical protein